MNLIGESNSALDLCEEYYWRSLPLAQRTGSDIFAALFQAQTAQPGAKGIAALLESPYPLPANSLPEAAQAMARYSICAGAARLTARGAQLWTPKIGQILPLLRQMGSLCEQTKHQAPDKDLPVVGGWLGWLGYDAAWEIERLPWLKDDQLPFPVAFWYEPAEFAVLDHHLQRLWLAAETRTRLDDMVRQLSRSGIDRINFQTISEAIAETPLSLYREKTQNSLKETSVAEPSESLIFETTQAEFKQAVRQAKSHIRAGSVFQVNHSLRFQATTAKPSWEVYQTLHQINPSPFASYWHTPWGAVVSCSPERLVHLKSGVAQSRPIAGTRPRGATPDRDEAIAHELITDPKEKAEHIMLVDLERNDLGRVCQWGSVQVAELMAVERYSHVMHLVSNVIGELDPDKSVAQLIAALFPGGTITGCPKVRCMEIIETLEPVRRSLFYGSCGYFDRRGQIDLNILIRTLLMSPPVEKPSAKSIENPLTTVWGQVGAGIVADSEPEREWRESLQKAKAQRLALGL
ncbi:MAG: chorismate-binding protein [Phormidesmis sp.]